MKEKSFQDLIFTPEGKIILSVLLRMRKWDVCEIIPEESGGFTLCFKCDENVNPDKYFYIEC